MKKGTKTPMELVLDKHGAGSIYRLGDRPVVHVSSIPTGSMGLDRATGIGGLPVGRIVEVYGPESSGKTTLCLHVVAEAQRKGMLCAFVDAEHALDPVYAQAIGVDVGELLVSQPDHGEQGLDVVDILTRTAAIGVVVVDSVAALTPKEELEGEMGKSHVGRQARLMNQALRKLTAIAAKSGTTIVFINQLRMKIGVLFGSPETTPGGNGLKFYASMRLDCRRRGVVRVGETATATQTLVKVVKNKCAPPFREARFDILYGHGIDAAAEALDLGVEAEAVGKSGSWYSWGGERMGNGRVAAAAFLNEHPKVLAAIRARVLKSG